MSSPRASFSLRSTLGLAGFIVVLLAAGCESSSSSDRPENGGDPAVFVDDAGTAGDAAPAAEADAGAAPNARAVELARMQAHLDSLYSATDVVGQFTTASGDDVDCLPFQKQPGFARVGSTDGMAPVLASPFLSVRPASSAGFGEGLDSAGRTRACPSNAVPVRRLTMVELSRFATLEDFFRKAPAHVVPPNVGNDEDIHDHAVYQSQVANWGAQATLNLWNPAVQPDTFSLSQLWVVRGTDDDLQSLEAGWTADRFRHPDDATSRLFIYSTAGNYKNPHKTDCYDLTCAAFVQLANSRILVGGKFDRASVMNGEQRQFTLRWQFCPASECRAWEGWWLRYDAGVTSEWVGFYPRSLYSAKGLHDQGDRIDFGGEVAFHGPAHAATAMGSGQSHAAGFARAAYQTDLLRITTDHSWASFDALLTHGAEAPSCYDSGSHVVGQMPSQTFYFGGAGVGGACK